MRVSILSLLGAAVVSVAVGQEPAPSPASAPTPPEEKPRPVLLKVEIKGTDFYAQGKYSNYYGDKFDSLTCRYWAPSEDFQPRGLLVMFRYPDDDSRDAVDDRSWQALTRKTGLALMSVKFEGGEAKLQDSEGDAFEFARSKIAKQAENPAITSLPMVVYGYSAAGRYAYDYAIWKPEQVIGFINNQGDLPLIYLFSPQRIDTPSTLSVPGLFFQARDSTNEKLSKVVTANRKRGALWTYAPYSGSPKDASNLYMTFIQAAVNVRLGPLSSSLDSELKQVDETQGFVGDLSTFETREGANSSPEDRSDTWLLDAATAEAWKKLVTK